MLQSYLTLCDPKDCSRQAPLSMGFSKQEPRSGLPFPSPGDLPAPGREPSFLTSPALAGGFFSTSATSSRVKTYNCFWYSTVIKKKRIWWGQFQVFNTGLTQWTDSENQSQSEHVMKASPTCSDHGEGGRSRAGRSQQGTLGHDGKTGECAPVCTLHLTRQASALLRGLAPNRVNGLHAEGCWVSCTAGQEFPPTHAAPP